MSAHEFSEWVAIYLQQPFDDARLYDVPQALMRATALTIAGAKEVDVAELLIGNARQNTMPLEKFAAQWVAGKP